MKPELHYLDSHHAVLRSSIINLPIYTADTDDTGQLCTNGTNRGLSCGISPVGQHHIYLTTNGDDCLLYDDEDDARNFFLDLGDNNQPDEQAIEQGIARMRQAVDLVCEIYTGNEIVRDQLSWYLEQCDAQAAALARGRP